MYYYTQSVKEMPVRYSNDFFSSAISVGDDSVKSIA